MMKELLYLGLIPGNIYLTTTDEAKEQFSKKGYILIHEWPDGTSFIFQSTKGPMVFSTKEKALEYAENWSYNVNFH